MQAVKVFNNNAVSVVMPDGREAILVGNGLESMYTVLLQRDSRNEVCLQRINAYLRQEFEYELDHQEQVYLLIHLTKIVG